MWRESSKDATRPPGTKSKSLLVSIGIYIAIIAIVALVSLMLWGVRGRGKPIKCPRCGETFKRPAFAEKHLGVGLSITGLGDYRCPKCGFKGRTSEFLENV